jgi:hypothetical protein
VKRIPLVITLFLLLSGWVLFPSQAQKKYQAGIEGKGQSASTLRRGLPSKAFQKEQGDLRSVAASGQEAASAGVAAPKIATGPTYSNVPALTAEQQAAREKEMDEENLTVPVRQGDHLDILPSPSNASTEPSLIDSSNSILAATDFTYQTVHDLTSTEAPNRSVIDEPSVGNMGNTVFLSGNWYAARSSNGGQSFTYVNPFNTFPSINGGFCCDQQVNYAPNQDMMLWALQYINDSTSGTLRVARAVGSTAVANNTWTYYDFNPQIFGFASGNFMDFPTMTVSTTYLYLTSNVFNVSNNFTGSVIWRIPLSDLASGGIVHFDYFTRTDVGSLRCTDGATTTMYWGTLVSTSQVRIYRWDDGSGSISWDDINISPFTYLNRDGVAVSPDGTNWAARADSRIQGAWVAGGVIGLMWAAKQGGSFPYPYTIIDRFNQSNRALLTQNQLWSSQNAWLYPAVSVNAAGNLAGLANYGGGSFYPGTNIWISDDVQGGFNPLTLYGAAASNIGPPSNTWGDFQTIRRHKDSPNTWVASTHYLQNSGSNAIPRYLWVGRQRDFTGASCTTAQMTSPANGSNIQSTTTFTWNTGTGNDQYWLYVGTAGAGSSDLFNESQGTNTSRTVTNLPAGNLYVRLWSHCASTNLWSFNDYIYQGSTLTGTWNQLAASPPAAVTNCLLLTDARVMCQRVGTNQWFALTPNSNGSYANGTWSSLASMQSGYNPIYFASAVLPDGRVIVEGGEYNCDSSGANCMFTWQTKGAIYNPITNSWTAVSPPSGWTSIGDAAGIVLADGTFFLSDALSTKTAKFNANTLTWTAFGTGFQAPTNDESGWTLLPDNSLLTVDATPTNSRLSERFNPSTGVWSGAGNTPVSLADNDSARGNNASFEIGPGVLRPDGTVFFLGANPNIGTPCCAGPAHTAIFSTATSTWSAGPNIPNGDAANDAPAAVLPNGNVLMHLAPPADSTNVFGAPSRFYEFNGSSIFQVNSPPVTNYPSFVGGMLVLPNGQVLLTHQSTDAYVYTPVGAASAAWVPTITSVSSTLSPGVTYTISGRQLNGLTQGAYYGDDLQAATNYPLVRITNNATGHVFYARTHGHSSMGVATGSATVSTSFDVPAGIELGASTLAVVANGIASSAVSVTISNTGVQVTVQTSPSGRSFTVDGATYSSAQTFSWASGSSHAISTTSPQSGGAGTQHVWSSWSDGGAISHTVAPSSNITYTANFTTQYLLTMSAGAGGTVSPPSGYFNSGQSVSMSASPLSGYSFNSWSGVGSGSFSGTSNPASVTMNGPITEAANFDPLPPPPSGTNFALASNGGVATASSTLDSGRLPSAANNGDRKGIHWGSDPSTGSGWHDATSSAYPDWLQIDFNGTHSINEIDVFSVQDNYANPIDPTLSTTFSAYGITAFDVQYWDGASWLTVPGGSVTGNNKVWRQFTFASPIQTANVRVLVNNSLAGYSRITEVEAWGPGAPPSSNVALTSNGGVASASSTLDSGRLPSAANNGDRKGIHWGSDPSTGSGWHDATSNSFPDFLQIDFSGSKTINEIDVFSVQDNYTNPAEPTDAMTFTLYGLTIFDVQYWDGASWVTVPGGSVTGNNLVKRKFTFSPISTTKIRVLVSGALAGYSRITEVEAWTAPNVALTSNGGVASASSTLDAGRLPSAANNGDRKGIHWGSDPSTGSGWHDATSNNYPDFLQVDFSGSKTIGEIDVFSVQDNYTNPAEPTDAMTFSLYGITTFDVQYWNGSSWVTVPGGSVIGNNLVKRKFSFSPITTSKIRVLVNSSLAGYSRIVEVEAY